MSRDLWKILWAYLVAVAVGGAVLWLLPWPPLWDALAADVVATLVIFGFSRAHRNSSLYDAYWSVIPPLLALFWLWQAAPETNLARAWLVLALVTLWAVRLTWNWAAHWPGMHHEDWRYAPLRDKAGRLECAMDLLAIHLFPTLQVFAGLLPVYAATCLGAAPLGWLDGLATVVVVGAVLIELVADRQLHCFLASRQPGQIINSGLWAWSRHPNYFGELSFWVGLMLFGIAAYPEGSWWLVLGAVLMAAMFMFASIPMMDQRSLERRPAYAEHMKKVSALVPWPPKP